MLPIVLAAILAETALAFSASFPLATVRVDAKENHTCNGNLDRHKNRLRLPANRAHARSHIHAQRRGLQRLSAPPCLVGAASQNRVVLPGCTSSTFARTTSGKSHIVGPSFGISSRGVALCAGVGEWLSVCICWDVFGVVWWWLRAGMDVLLLESIIKH